MENRKNLKISIFGKNYNISTDESEDLFLSAASYLDNMMKNLSEKTSLNDEAKIAVLAALQISVDLAKCFESQKLCQNRAATLSSLIEKEVR